METIDVSDPEPTWWLNKEGEPVLVTDVSYNTDYANDEHEVAVIPMTPELAARLLGLMNKVNELKKAESDLSAVSFWNYACEYWPANADDEPMVGEPRFDLEAGRTECDKLDVGDDWVQWHCYIKNTDIELHSETLTRKNIIKFLEGVVVWPFGDPKAAAKVTEMVEKWRDNPANADLLR